VGVAAAEALDRARCPVEARRARRDRALSERLAAARASAQPVGPRSSPSPVSRLSRWAKPDGRVVAYEHALHAEALRAPRRCRGGRRGRCCVWPHAPISASARSKIAGFGAPTSLEVDHGVEQLGERKRIAPRTAELARVVRDERRAVALLPQRAGARDQRLARLRPRSCAPARAGIQREARASPRLHDAGPRPSARFELAALEPVPRMIGVELVGTEHDLEYDARIGAEFARDVLERAERRRSEDAAEVEEDGVVAPGHRRTLTR
jgi:hypothetical protein